MNKKIPIIIFFVFFAGHFVSQAQYEYLRYTNLEKWKTLSHSEKIEASQIPYNVLDTMSTATLLKLCLSYPLLPDIFAFDDHLFVFQEIKKRVNVFQVFYERQDACQNIITTYKENKPENIAKPENRNNVPYVFLFNFLDIMAGQTELIGKLNFEQRTELLSVLTENVQQRIEYSQYYSSASFAFSAIPMFHIFQKENKTLTKDSATLERINDFINTGNYQSWNDVSLILMEGLKYSNTNH